jgi:hypothetical protein
MKQKVWTTGPNSWNSISIVWLFILKCQIKRHGKRRFIWWYRYAIGKEHLTSSSAIFGV